MLFVHAGTRLRRLSRVVLGFVLVASPILVAAEACLPQFTFSRATSDTCAPAPRGGTSRGADVTLAPAPRPAFKALQAPGLTAFERDRRAILAMAGGYRASFEFLEVIGFTADWTPDRPYQSWGTEIVKVIEDRGDFISLQHIMVMVYEDESGERSEPMVMKHWRQDWQYEPTEVLSYDGHDRWSVKPVHDGAGRWSQTVWQVDDSPRYGAVGGWRHEAGFSSWESGLTLRPVPRREASVRSDYQALEGINRHIITPAGWVQEEENEKLRLTADGQPESTTPYLARELGFNRYDAIVDHDFAPAEAFWTATADYWRAVRAVFAAQATDDGVLQLATAVDGVPLFAVLFGGANDWADAADPAQRPDAAALIAPYLR